MNIMKWVKNIKGGKKKIKNILIISQYFRPDITAAAFRISDLYDTIEKDDNIQAKVITTYPHKSKGNVKNNKNEKNILRVKIPKLINIPFIKYLFQYFYFVIFAIIKGIFLSNKNFDYIFVSSPPLFVSITGIILSKIKKASLIVDIRDIWPDSAVAAGMVKNNSLIYKLAKKLEIITYKKSNLITCVSKPMKKYISNYTESNKVKVVYNGISNKDIKVVDKINEDKNIKSNKKRNIFYAGNIGIAQKVDILAKILYKDDFLRKTYNFKIIGGGAEEDKLKNYITKNNLECVEIIGQFNKGKTMRKLKNNADILFIHLKDKEVFSKTIPSKVFDYLLLNKPIIYGIKGEGKDILDQLQCGVNFNNESLESLREALYKMNDNYDYFLKNSQDNYKFVRKYFSRDILFEKLIEYIIEN